MQFLLSFSRFLYMIGRVMEDGRGKREREDGSIFHLLAHCINAYNG